MSETTDSKRRTDGLSGMLLPELKQLAQQLGIAGSSAMRKSDLVSAIGERQNQASTRRAAPKSAPEKEPKENTAHTQTQDEPAKSDSGEDSQQEQRRGSGVGGERRKCTDSDQHRNGCRCDALASAAIRLEILGSTCCGDSADVCAVSEEEGDSLHGTNREPHEREADHHR